VSNPYPNRDFKNKRMLHLRNLVHRCANGICDRSFGTVRARNLVCTSFRVGGTMIGKLNEKWMEVCELAVKEQDPKKLIALIAEIGRLLEEKAQRVEKRATSHY
jgi:hypothetical protein